MQHNSVQMPRLKELPSCDQQCQRGRPCKLVHEDINNIMADHNLENAAESEIDNNQSEIDNNQNQGLPICQTITPPFRRHVTRSLAPAEETASTGSKQNTTTASAKGSRVEEIEPATPRAAVAAAAGATASERTVLPYLEAKWEEEEEEEVEGGEEVDQDAKVVHVPNFRRFVSDGTPIIGRVSDSGGYRSCGKNFICSSCHEILIKATIAVPCEHIVCATCFGGKYHECPTCHERLWSTLVIRQLDTAISCIATNPSLNGMIFLPVEVTRYNYRKRQHEHEPEAEKKKRARNN